MNLILGFAPFIAFAVLGHFGSAVTGLWVSAGLALGLLLRSRLPPRRPVKILEAGAAALFVALAVAGSAMRLDLSVFALRMVIDVGLFAIVLGSILVGQPFTLQYAREQVPRERWGHPLFIAVNRRISAVWAAAFAVEILCSASLAWAPSVPSAIPVAVNVLALVGAVRFTLAYPRRVRARQQALSPAA